MAEDDNVSTVISPTESKLSQPGIESGNELSRADVRHNMIVVIMLDAIFGAGATDFVLAATPLYVFLGASDTLIGAIGSAALAGLLGVFLSPFITRRFRLKKWYLFVTHVPYLGALGVIGLVLALSGRLGLSNEWLLSFVVIMMIIHNLFAGFVSLPHQEYTAACIPMSHRGRFSGYSLSIGSALAIGSSLIAREILQSVPRPMAFGYLFLLTWFVCQGGYILALFGREKPTPVEQAPPAWSKAMIKAAWNDKPFIRVMLLNAAYYLLFWPLFFTFVPAYGYREIGMAAAAAATISIITQVIKVAFSAQIGLLTDKLSPKRIIPIWPLVAVMALAPPLILRNSWGVYISSAISMVFICGVMSAFMPLLYGIPSPENRAGHFTMQLLMQYVTQALGPLLIGAMCQALSYRMTFLVVAALALALCPISKRVLSTLSSEAKAYS